MDYYENRKDIAAAFRDVSKIAEMLYKMERETDDALDNVVGFEETDRGNPRREKAQDYSSDLKWAAGLAEELAGSLKDLVNGY